MLVTIEKIENRPDAIYPNNNIKIGEKFTGSMSHAPKEGRSFSVTYEKQGQFKAIVTSPVTKVIDKNTFKTLNSVYRIVAHA
jgi:hypothetical protein